MGARGLVRLLLIAVALSVPGAVASAQTTDDFFNGDVLQDLRLAIHSKDWNALRTNFQDNTYYPCDFTWNGITVRNVGIRSRGLGSRSSSKPGLRVDFDRYSTQQKFLGLKSVILDNVVQDPTTMKERLTMLFLAKMGQPAPRETHVRLFVNNQYFGLYVLVESIDRDFLERTLGEDEGFLFEYNYTYDWKMNYLGPDLAKYSELFDPKTHEKDATSVIYGPIEDLVQTANETSDSLFEQRMSQYLNLEEFTTHIGLENVIAEWDGVLGYAGMNNFYLYRPNASTVSRFITWDKDNTFKAPDFHIRSGMGDNVLARRVTSIRRYADHYYNVLLLGANALSEHVEGLPEGTPPTTWLRYHIDRISQQIAVAMQQDTVKPFTMEEFNNGVNDLRTFAAERPRFLRCEATKEITADQGRIDAACAAPRP
jgi:spore coat protein CotH